MPINTHKPTFTASEITIRDDDKDHAFFGLFYKVPGFNHVDYIALLMLQRLFGDYKRE